MMSATRMLGYAGTLAAAAATAAAAAGIATAAHAGAPLCERWSDPVAVGGLDVALLPEASGIAISARAERLYHVNDGTRGVFFITALDGSAARRVRVTGFAPRDVEDLALGPCGDRSCLYIADVGDNAERRPSVRIAIVEEQAHFGTEVEPLRVVEARYPDGPHNAEAVAVHPSGDLVLVTKAPISLVRRTPARVYRLRAAQLAAGGEQTFEAVGVIPYAALTDIGLPLRRVVTAMDFAPDGSRFLLLSYDSAVEIAVDLAAGLPAPSAWVEGSTHRSLRIEPLRQAEAVAYDVDGRSILYSTEAALGSAAPLIRQSCAG